MPVMRTPLALLNLVGQPARTSVSICGIAFAILLIFMQLGFLGSVSITATRMFDTMQGELIVRSPEYLHLYEPRTIPRDALRYLAGQPDVIDTLGLDVVLAKWQSPADGTFRAIAVLGIDPRRPALRIEDLAPQAHLLETPANILIDRASHPEFGPRNSKRFSDEDIGQTTDLMNRRVQIAGHVHIGTGLAANGALVTSHAGFARVAPTDMRDRTSIGVIRLAPGVDPDAAAVRLRAALDRLGGTAARLQILTLDQARRFELDRWIWQTPIGLIFMMGVCLAVLVGTMVCYMILATDVIGHLPEYATLRAIGYGTRYLVGVLLKQSLWLATAAYLPAVAGAYGIYLLTERLAGIDVQMTLPRLVGVFLLSILMCSAAGLSAVKKLSRAEPASLF